MTDAGPPTVWSVWHFLAAEYELGSEDRDNPHLVIGFFATEVEARDVVERLRRAAGFQTLPTGFRVWQEPLDGSGAWEEGFSDTWDDPQPPVADDGGLRLPDPLPARRPAWLWNVRHFKVPSAMAQPEPHGAKGIGLYSSLANAEAAVAHRRRQPGFRDWPQGFRIFRRRLGVVFGLEGFRERYGWEAWRDSLRG
ncbi:MAG: hypothetical protein NTY94_09525 [Alphaproteobacteria bacterium]|nr:hypothetical protein [Alphaproteobacteria bacterium]